MPNGKGTRGKSVGGRGVRGKGSRGRGGGSRGRGGGSRGRGREGTAPDFAVAGPSTRTVEEEYALIKINEERTKKVVKSLDPSVRKELIARKRMKQLSRSLLPDAPPRKRAKKNSPVREECRLIPGTPRTPPAPKLQPWQMREDSSPERQESTLDCGIQNTLPATKLQLKQMGVFGDDDMAKDRICSFPLSTIKAVSSGMPELQVGWTTRQSINTSILRPVAPQAAPHHLASPPLAPATIKAVSSGVPDLQVDWTTGQLKNPSTSRPVASQAAPHHRASPPLSPASSISFVVKQVNETIRSAEPQNISDTLHTWLEESDGELDVDSDDMSHEQIDLGQIHLTPADVTDHLDEYLQDWVNKEDMASDRLLQQLLPIDQFIFDWNHDHATFSGQRETFRGNHGPTFPVTDDTKPLDIFLKIFDDEFFDLLIRQTNKYATRQIEQHLTEKSRLNFFKNVDKGEMAIFLAILIFQGLVLLPVETNYWSENGYMTLKYFKDLMTYNRFVLLKRLLHFTDSTDINQLNLTKDEQRLKKIQPVLDILNKKFSSLYLPGQNICIDESLLKWKGRLSFSQKILTKAAKIGIKSFELCESATGYLWSFIVYAEKTDGPTDRQTDEPTDGLTLPTGVTSKTVYDLIKPLLNQGHTLVMDNFYNSPLLARYLKSKGTDCYGTLRVNRQFVPVALKSMLKSELRPGELVQSFTRDLSVILWRDTNLVSMISTYHSGVVGGKEKYGRYKYKPQVVLDYNLEMGGVDKKDQLLSSFPMERVRNQVWYKKVFRRLLNCAIVNCYVIYKSHTPHATHRWFRNQLAEELVKAFKPPQVERHLKVLPKKFMSTNTNKVRPILSGNHFIGKSKYTLCVWCRKSRTKYICKQCEVSLCLQICFEKYHTVSEHVI